MSRSGTTRDTRLVDKYATHALYLALTLAAALIVAASYLATGTQ